MKNTFLVLLFFILAIANSKAAKPVIIDSDMGWDDEMAILYAAVNPSLDLKAVTVSTDGLAYGKEGAENATKILRLATGDDKVPVYLGKDYGKSIHAYPRQLRESVSRIDLPGYDSLKDYSYSKENSAARAIYDLVVSSTQKVSIISIGSATNIADACEYARNKNYRKFRENIAMVYKGGGAFGSARFSKDGKSPSNMDIKGNLSMPDIYFTNNSQAEWNIYPNAEKMDELMYCGLPITFIPLELTDKINITKESYLMLSRAASDSRLADFVAKTVAVMAESSGGWKQMPENFDYWDPAVTVAAVADMTEDPSKMISGRFNSVPVIICTESGDYDRYSVEYAPEKDAKSKKYPYYFFNKVEGLYYYGATLVDMPAFIHDESAEKGDSRTIKPSDLFKKKPVKVDIIESLDKELFYKEFVSKLKLCK